MMIFSTLLTLHFLYTVVAQEECEKYVQAATTATSNMQSKYFTNNVDYGDQQPWISAVDVFYLGQLDKILVKQNSGNVIDTVFSRSDVQAGKRDETKKYYNIRSSTVDNTYCKGGLFWSGLEAGL
ncbi:hypothetical protein EDD85DRAFT_1028780 [Armillaria nabsnona]|nr:hypothetical protein EDD85DRAFT_1028780 [Armillaria nabsnona]